MAIEYRVGGHWPTSIIRIDTDEKPDELGRRPSDHLMGMALTPEDAATLVRLANLGIERS